MSMTLRSPPPYPHLARAWAFVIILFVASIMAVIDRAVLNIVVDPVKSDLHISDVQISLLQGLAFGFFNAAVGIPLGLTADRYSRLWLIIAGMSLWCAATVAGGLVHTFTALFLTRLLVGLGEAALGPATVSLIADLFPHDQRGRPISVFLMGGGLAFGLSISIAGSIMEAARAGRFEAIPILSDLVPWRVVFVLCGLAGLTVVALLLTMREPMRRGAVQTQDLRSQIKTSTSYMVRNWTIFLPFYLGFAFCFAAVYGAAAWTPTMLIRQFGANGAQLAQRLGPLSVMFSVLGPLAAGFVVDRLARQKSHQAKLLILGFAPLAFVPSALAVFAPGQMPAIVLVASSGAVAAFIGTVTFAALQSMTPTTMRGVAISLTGLVNTVIGATLGPLLVAEFTQHLYRNPDMVGYSIATLAVSALILGAGSFSLSYLALKHQFETNGEVARMIAL